MIQVQSHTDRLHRLQKEMDSARKTITSLTDISSDDQNKLFFESAFEWLAVITDNDDQAMQQLPKLREFWGFWKKTWFHLDMVFINHVYAFCLNDEETRNYYYMIHRTTIDNRHAHSTSVECDYHMLMKKLSNRI